MAEQRLQKVLAAAGVDSRRKCEELILDGEVRVNGMVVDSLPVFVDPAKDEIKVRGRKIRFAERVYFALNKPKGVICTNSDPQGRRKAIDLVPTKERIYCVGRLDVDSGGLIILTNDNELANKLTHPKFKLPKTYRVEVKGMVGADAVEKLKKGIWLAEGKTGRSSVKILKKGQRLSIIEMRITQGLNRQIRRMLAKVDLPVKSLKRTKIGKLDIRGLGVGKYRKLTSKEIAYLKGINSV
jgi:23S rRNA pseudouridine2605 synthase